jgi:hypothetical protein
MIHEPRHNLGLERLRLAHPRLALCFVLDLGRILSERFRVSDALAGAGERG